MDAFPIGELPVAEHYLEFLPVSGHPFVRTLFAAAEADEPLSGGDRDAGDTVSDRNLRDELGLRYRRRGPGLLSERPLLFARSGRWLPAAYRAFEQPLQLRHAIERPRRPVETRADSSLISFANSPERSLLSIAARSERLRMSRWMTHSRTTAPGIGPAGM